MALRAEIQSVTPEAWANMLQPPLRKSLVSGVVTNSRFEPNLRKGDTFHYSYFSGDNEVVDYSEFTSITGHEKMETTDDTLVVDKQPLLRKVIDNVEELYTNVSAQVELADEAAYKLKDYIDQDVLMHILDANITLNSGDIKTIDTTNVINLMTDARKVLRQNNVEENGDWIAILPAEIAEQIELKATDTGMNVADSAFRNGYAGDFVGFKIYLSNNLPDMIEITDAATGITSTDVGTSDYDEGDVVSKEDFIAQDEWDETVYNGVEDDYKAKACYFGRRGMIHTAFKAKPSMKRKDIPDQLGEYFYFYTVYGSDVFEKFADRFAQVYLRA